MGYQLRCTYANREEIVFAANPKLNPDAKPWSRDHAADMAAAFLIFGRLKRPVIVSAFIEPVVLG